MYKVEIEFTSIHDEIEDFVFETEMPLIPKKKSILGIWVRGEYIPVKVTEVIYLFDMEGKYDKIEIDVTDW